MFTSVESDPIWEMLTETAVGQRARRPIPRSIDERNKIPSMIPTSPGCGPAPRGGTGLRRAQSSRAGFGRLVGERKSDDCNLSRGAVSSEGSLFGGTGGINRPARCRPAHAVGGPVALDFAVSAAFNSCLAPWGLVTSNLFGPF